jgi:hypothetical protein
MSIERIPAETKDVIKGVTFCPDTGIRIEYEVPLKSATVELPEGILRLEDAPSDEPQA